MGRGSCVHGRPSLAARWRRRLHQAPWRRGDPAAGGGPTAPAEEERPMTGPAVPLRRERARARLALASALACFVAAQLAFVLAAEWWQPKLRDPEYGRKLERLRSRLAENPRSRPLIRTLGSSRVSMGIRPDCLPPCAGPEGQTPLVFNFGICRFASLGELLCLRRLLSNGIRPDVVIVEIWPPLLVLDANQVQVLDPNRLSRQDLALLQRYAY